MGRWACASLIIPIAFAAFDEVLTDWDYDNFSAWAHIYPSCDDVSQSPINVNFPITQQQSTEHIVPLRFQYPPLSTITIDEIPTYSARISNDDNGLLEQLIVPPGSLIPAVGTWLLETCHFHWGATAATGSEHTYNGQRFPAELHLIHRNPKYASLDIAFTKADGLLVLGVMFQIQDRNNTELAKMDLEHLVVNVSARTIISNVSLSWNNLLPADAATNFATYSGSLTTPPCSEIVRWVLFQTPLHISNYQLNLLRSVVRNNYRPTQPYNGRKVLYSWTDNIANGACAFSATLVAFILLLVA